MKETFKDWKNGETAAPALTSPRHFRGLDGLRGIAVLMVMCVHAPVPIFPSGYVGLDIFFVLSGFLISGIVLDKLEAGRFSARSFYVHRVARIMPALLLMLAVVTALEWSVPQWAWPRDVFWPGVRHALMFTTHYHIFHGGIGSPLVHLWSLAYEADFYLLFPLILIAAYRFNMLRVVFTSGVLFIVASMGLRVYVHAFQHVSSNAFNIISVSRTDGFMVGALINWILRRKTNTPSVLYFTLFAVPLALLFSGMQTNVRDGVGYSCTIAMLSSALFIVGSVILPAHPIVRVFDWWPLRWVGQISYGLYLWHFPILALFRKQSMSGLRIAFCFALSILCATLSYYLLERRFLTRR